MEAGEHRRGKENRSGRRNRGSGETETEEREGGEKMKEDGCGRRKYE
jgi:hypothetical protein